MCNANQGEHTTQLAQCMYMQARIAERCRASVLAKRCREQSSTCKADAYPFVVLFGVVLVVLAVVVAVVARVVVLVIILLVLTLLVLHTSEARVKGSRKHFIQWHGRRREFAMCRKRVRGKATAV